MQVQLRRYHLAMPRRRRNPDRPGDIIRRRAAGYAYAAALASIKDMSHDLWPPHGAKGYAVTVYGKRGYFPDFMLEIVSSPGAFVGKAITYGDDRGGLDYVIQLNARTSDVARHRSSYQPTAAWLDEVHQGPSTAKARTRLAAILKALRATFIHEITHVIDEQRTKGKISTGSSATQGEGALKSYFNSPVELNAYYQMVAEEYAHDFRKHVATGNIRADILDAFEIFFGATADEFWKRYFKPKMQGHMGYTGFGWLTQVNVRRFRKRAAGLWETLRERALGLAAPRRR